MSLTKPSLAGNNLIFPGQGEFGKWHTGWGREMSNIFLQCNVLHNRTVPAFQHVPSAYGTCGLSSRRALSYLIFCGVVMLYVLDSPLIINECAESSKYVRASALNHSGFLIKSINSLSSVRARTLSWWINPYDFTNSICLNTPARVQQFTEFFRLCKSIHLKFSHTNAPINWISPVWVQWFTHVTALS